MARGGGPISERRRAKNNSRRRSNAQKQTKIPRKVSSKKGTRRGGRFTTERRHEIIQQASLLFVEHGYENVSIDDIVARIGGSKATLYSRFGGKEGLFETVIKEYCAGVDRGLKVELTGGVEEQLFRIGQAFLRELLSPQILELHRLMVSMGKKFPAVGRLFYRAGPESAYDYVARWIGRQQKLGAIKSGDRKQLAALFLDMLTGEHQLGRLVSFCKTSSPHAIDRTVRGAVSIFLHGAARQKRS